MATTAGALSRVSIAETALELSSAAATGGTAPYTYQWHRSLESGFTPGAGNLISGATALALDDTGLEPGTQYYYKMVATDDGAVSGTSAELAMATSVASQDPNQFEQSNVLGMLDLLQNVETIAARIAASELGSLRAGQAVKIVDNLAPIPEVEACDANDDEVFGFINYNIKDKAFVASDMVEISQAGNVMWLQATGAIGRGAQVVLDVLSVGGVKAAAGESGDTIVGYTIDKAVGGQLVRVKLGVPSFAVVA